jgi:hypothetical protein
MGKRAELRQVIDTATLRPVATEARRSEPLAVVGPKRRAVLVNIKIAESSAIDLARKAAATGIIQKQCVTGALVAAEVGMDPLDLEDRTQRRRTAAA